MAINTVGDLVAELLKQPQDLPVLVGCHYDNDNGLTNQVSVRACFAAQTEGDFYIDVEPGWGYTGTFQAVTVS